MPYKVTRDEIFRAAKMCAIRGVPTQAAGKLTTEEDISQEDVPRAVEFRRRSRCEDQAVRTIAASLVGVGAVSA
jgi:hypothetical protein